jgi:hypothetical protein
VRKSVLDGELSLTLQDLRDWNSLKPENAKAIHRLVTEEPKMRPYKCYEFIKSELPQKVQDELFNRASGTVNGVYTADLGAFKVTVELAK